MQILWCKHKQQQKGVSFDNVQYTKGDFYEPNQTPKIYI